MRNLTHKNFRPVVVIAACTGRDAEYLWTVAPVVHKRRILAVYIGIVFGAHVTAASPCFVTHTPETHTPGFLATVCFSEIGHRAHAIKVCILYPFGNFLYGTAAYV